jgi:hypothetical protein
MLIEHFVSERVPSHAFGTHASCFAARAVKTMGALPAIEAEQLSQKRCYRRIHCQPNRFHMQDDKLFDRNFEQLKAYYTDMHGVLPPSQQEYPILGLNLLRLLAQNRIAEFHVELELLGPEAQASSHVAFPRQLEQQLMEGLYDKLYSTMQQEKSPRTRAFLSQLQATIRDESATCAALVCSVLLAHAPLSPCG